MACDTFARRSLLRVPTANVETALDVVAVRSLANTKYALSAAACITMKDFPIELVGKHRSYRTEDSALKLPY